MMNMRNHTTHLLWKTLLPLALPGLLGTACEKAEQAPTPSESRFSLVLEEGTALTRSLLQSADIETRITSVTLALYRGGVLVESAYYGSGWDQMSFPLEDGTYTAYALVNMGDQRDAIPADESALDGFTYAIPGYLNSGSGIEYRGIPMAGRLSYTVGTSTSSAIPVKRLMAKVTANLSCEWTGLITSVKVFNLNRSLKPFGTSAAASANDILPENEFQTGTGTASGSFVFYVPENLQGTVAGIAGPADKSPEGSATVASRQGLMTYLEVLVSGTSGVDGTIRYRSFLGSDATSNFDIRRNCRYTWTLRYLPDGRLYNDWKHENLLAWSEYRYEISPTALNLYAGESGTVRIYRQEDRYVNGSFRPGAAYQQYGRHFSWSYASPDNPALQNDLSVIQASLSGDYYYVYGVGSGTRRITATGPDGSTAVNLHCDVHSMNYRRQLLMLADPGPRAAVGQTIHLKTLVYTTQNGITTAGGDVSGDILYCHIYSGLSSAGYDVPAQGHIRGTSAGDARFSAKYLHLADGKEIYANGLSVTFEDSVTGYLTITGGDTPGTVGSTLALKAFFTDSNGGSATEVTSQASWVVQDGSTLGFRVYGGNVTGQEAGAAVIQASYSANGHTYQAQAIVTFNSH